MIKINRRSSFLRPLLVTALPFGLLSAGAMSAHAGSVSVTGANGVTPGGAAPPATADEGHLIPNSDPSNTAEATGGNGGAGGNGATIRRCIFHCPPAPPATAGGAGGAATATATTSISSTTQATATATSAGGAGGAGWSNKVGGVGGTGNSSATASNTKGSASATATATGGRGGADAPGTTAIDPWAYGGFAQAYATGVALTGNVQANASANGGWALIPGTAAFAQSEAKNSKGEALTTASAPADAGGISPSAVTSAGVGSGSNIPITLNSSQVVSDAILTLTPNPQTKLLTIGEGAMSAAFSGGLLTQTYAATAVFDFKTSASEGLDLTVLSDKVMGIGFDSLELQVINLVDNKTLLSDTFSSATTFFAPGHSISLPGEIAAGSQSIKIDFSLSYWNTTSITPNASFGFTYALVDPPLAATPLSAAIVPEPSTWAMMLIGFAGLAFAEYRRSRKRAAFAA